MHEHRSVCEREQKKERERAREEERDKLMGLTEVHPFLTINDANAEKRKRRKQD